MVKVYLSRVSFLDVGTKFFLPEEIITENDRTFQPIFVRVGHYNVIFAEVPQSVAVPNLMRDEVNYISSRFLDPIEPSGSIPTVRYT